MIIKEEKVVQRILTIKKYMCDICNKEVLSDNILGTGKFETYHKSESSIFYCDGSNYAEDGYEPDGEGFNICGQCMKDKLFPLIKETFKINSIIIDNAGISYYDF